MARPAATRDPGRVDAAEFKVSPLVARATRSEEAQPFFFSSRRRHTRYWRDWSSDVCSSDLLDEWMSSAAKAHFEMRDEGLLKLFFAEELSVDQLRAQIDIMRRRHQRAIEHL